MKDETINISNPEKILFPQDEITKLEVVNYYVKVAEHILPFIENRLLSVIRCHQGIEGNCFFKKHPTNDKEFVHTFMDKDEEYFYINSEKELVVQVQMGTIEFHTWGSVVSKINKPNFMVFDLDPDESLPLKNLREAVEKVKVVLDSLSLTSFLKTSGGKGYHIYIPFSKTKNWKNFYSFSHQIAKYVENRWPKLFTTNLKKSERKGKIFIDYLRNYRGSTCVAPFSVRARQNATISMPISWADLYKIKPNEVTINNYNKYINSAWKTFFEIKQELK